MLCVDIGNTSIRIAHWDGGCWARQMTTPTREPLSREALLDWLCDTPARSAAVASVVPERTDAVCEFLREGGVTVREIHFPEIPFIAHQLQTPQTTGLDRLCAARAAWELFHGSCVVVDAGTAVTVDLVTLTDGMGVFMGGAILPGPKMWLRSLFDNASQIPPIEWKGAASVSPCGDGTVAAMQAGAAYGLSGGIDRLIQEYTARVGGSVPVVLTGGAGQSLLPTLQSEVRWEPNLVLMGIRLVAAEYLFPEVME